MTRRFLGYPIGEILFALIIPITIIVSLTLQVRSCLRGGSIAEQEQKGEVSSDQLRRLINAIQEDSSQVVETDMSPETTTIDEERAVEIVRQRYKREIDEGVIVTCVADKKGSEFNVFVEFGSGYDAEGHLIVAPGSHELVTVSSSGEITRVIPGL